MTTAYEAEDGVEAYREEKNRILNQTYQLIQGAGSFTEIVYEFEQLILQLVEAERMTLYRRIGQELVSWYHTGTELEEEIRVPIGPSSIAGYVAMAHAPLRVDDAYNTDELASIHPSLAFEYSYDEASGYLSQSMVVVPLEHNGRLLGVLQLLNRAGGGVFSDQDVIHAIAISQILCQQFRQDLRPGLGPYEQLVNEGLLTLDQFEELENSALAQNLPVTILLKHEANIPLEAIGKSLMEYYQVPFLPYTEEFQPDQALLDNLNPSYLASNNWVPFRGDQGQTVVLLDEPNNTDRVMEIKQLLNETNIELRVGTREDIVRYLGFAYPEDEEPKDVNLEDIVGRLDTGLQTQASEETGEEGDLFDENASAIIQLVNRIIIEAVNLNASDIHVEPAKGKNDAIVRMRVDGECYEKLRIPHTHIRAVISRIKVLSKLDITEKRMPQDGKLAVKMEGKPLELRIATVPTVHGESVVMRVLASGEGSLPLDKINLLPRNHDPLMEMVERPHGIVLVVGPTGSGKTTTLHALLGHINKPRRKILTAEDPVEITQPGLQQLQVMPKIGLTFARALRSFLRADPDVILIGEMRDLETASIGIEASLTGHLVFSTLHTNSAPETVIRLLEMGLDPLNFADALICVLAQRLVRTLCQRCKEEYQASKEEIDRLVHLYGEEIFGELGAELGSLSLCRPKGCDLCMGTGYKGRTGIHELLVGSKEMKKMIARSATAEEIRQLAFQDGMRTLLQDGIAKILNGDTDLDQLRRVTVED